MEITKKKEYTIVKNSSLSLADFYKNIDENFTQFNGEHLIVNISEKINTNIKDLLLFLSLSTKHKANGTSFVIICKEIDIDEIPDELSIVPTFTEALDILEMDAIERDLGF